MHKTLQALTLTIVALFAAAPVIAQQPPPATAGSETAPLYVALGAKPGIEKLMGELIDRASVDPRIADTFKKSKMKLSFLKSQLTDQICVLSGGPCVYDGDTMAKSHADLKLQKSDFNALVEVLQDTMDAQGVGFTTQRQLLAILAPMHRDVVTVH
jgi:hemoglobin